MSTAPRRRSPTLEEHLQPCAICGYALSERHHPFRFALYGDCEITESLCPNCHSIYHLVESALSGSSESELLLNRLSEDRTFQDQVIAPIYRLQRRYAPLNKELAAVTRMMVGDLTRIRERLDAGETDDSICDEYWQRVRAKP